MKKKHLSVVILLAVLVLPAGMFVAMSFTGGHPLIGKEVDQPDWLLSSENKTEVFFFGYTECAFICPQSLFKLGDVLDSLFIEDPGLQVGAHFLDVNAQTQISRANQYSLAFSEHIQGHNLNAEELEVLKEEFGLSILRSRDENEEIFHTDYFFILSRDREDWTIHKVLSNNSNKETLAAAITEAAMYRK